MRFSLFIFYHLYSPALFANWRNYLFFFLLVSCFLSTKQYIFAETVPSVVKNYAQLERTKQFIVQFANEHGVERAKVADIFARVPVDKAKKDKLLNLAAKPLEKTATWEAYKKVFLNESRIALGKKFYKKNRAILVSSYKKYGVNTKIIVATLGMETVYGKNVGKYHVLQSLMAQSFFSVKRQKFFRKQLESLLLLHFNHDFPIFDTVGSYSGALGPAQFMPTSIYYYAVDSNNDGKKSMLVDYEDIIFSIANYYKQAKWKKAKAVVNRISSKNAYVENNNEQGVGKGKKRLKKHVLQLEENGERIYYKLHPNFYAIKRYNNSNYYAMALFLLSKEL